MGELANKMRAKFPGAYDDMDDPTLEAKIVAKYPEYKDLVTPEKPKMGKMEQFVAGVGGGMVGAGIGARQLLSEGARVFLPKSMEGGIDKYQAKLQAEEADRRQVMDQLKAERGGSAGLGNLASWGEFAGEVAPTIAMPFGAIAKGAKLGRAAIQGAKAGGLGGALLPTVEGESRGQNAAIGALVGGVATPAVGAAVKGVGAGIKGIEKGIENAIESTTLIGPKYTAGVPTPVKNKMVTYLRKAAPPKPGDIQSSAARARHWNNDVQAVKDVTELASEITMPDGLTRLPKNLDEGLAAVQQGINIKSGWIKEIADAAGEKVSLRPTIEELQGITAAKGHSAERVAQAQRLLNGMSTPDGGRIPGLVDLEQAGGLDVGAAITRMSQLNNDLRGFFKGQSVSGDAPEIIALYANTLKKSLNEVADKSVPGEDKAFTEARRSLGRMLGLEERMLRQIEARDRGLAKGGMSVFDILAAQQAIQALATGNVTKGVQAGGSLFAGTMQKLRTSPDAATRKMFEAAAKYAKPKGKPTVVPRSTPPKIGAYEANPMNPETLPPRWEGEMGIPGRPAGQLGLEEGGMPPRPIQGTGSPAVPRTPINNYGPAPESQVRPRAPINNYGPAPESQVRPRTPIKPPAPDEANAFIEKAVETAKKTGNYKVLDQAAALMRKQGLPVRDGQHLAELVESSIK